MTGCLWPFSDRAEFNVRHLAQTRWKISVVVVDTKEKKRLRVLCPTDDTLLNQIMEHLSDLFPMATKTLTLRLVE